MRKIIQKYNKALKVPQETYNEQHKDFLVPLDLWIDGEEEFKKLMEDNMMLDWIKELYDVLTGGRVVITENTFRYMIDPDVMVRLNLEISIALPPITRMAVEKLEELHSNIHDLLQAA